MEGYVDPTEKGVCNKDDVLKICNAVLNSGGGVLDLEFSKKLRDDDRNEKDLVDTFWQTVEPPLAAMISPSKYANIFERYVLSDRIRLFITSPNNFCTKKYNLYIQSRDASVEEASYNEVVDILKQKCPGPSEETYSNGNLAFNSLPEIAVEFSSGDVINLTEGRRIQFKHYTSGNDLFSNHGQRETLCKQLSAFGNRDGGLILLGVKDNREVVGVEIADTARNGKEFIVKEVASLVKKVCPSYELKRGRHWDVVFSPVSGSCPRFVIVIKIAAIRGFGGIFAKHPESYELRQDEGDRQAVRLLDISEWRKRVVVRMERQWENDEKAEMAREFQRVHIARPHLLTIKGKVQKIREAYFQVDEKFPILPKGVADNLPEQAQAFIHHIQAACCKNSNCGSLIVSRSLLRDIGGEATDGVICDVLAVSRNFGGLHLYTLYLREDEEDVTSQRYSEEASRALKRSILENGAAGQRFYVSCHLVPLSRSTEVSPLPDNRYPESYDLKYSLDTFNKILDAMVMALAAVPSTLSSKVGVTFLNLLTVEQYALVHEKFEQSRRWWVKGVAGSGKTYVAKEVMRQIKKREGLERNQILYVCENEGLATQVGKSDLCNAVCRVSFMRKEFPDAKHVILDEVHNYTVKRDSNSWYKKAERIARQHGSRGYQWFFMDMDQRSQFSALGMPKIQEPQFKLRKVFRNSTKIFTHAKECLGQTDLQHEVEMGHNLDGEDVMSLSCSKTSRLRKLKTTLEMLWADGYCAGDVAVLFLKTEEIPKKSLPSLLNDVGWTSARENDSKKLVISTVLRYSGLERPVVVLVDVHRGLKMRRLKPFLYVAMTRAMVKLIIIQEELE